jgi:glycogen(starch) synthase
MNRELAGKKRKGSLSVAEVFLDINHNEGSDNPLDAFVRNISGRFGKFGVDVRVFSTRIKTVKSKSFKSLTEGIHTTSQTIYRQLSTAHKKTLFHVIHCHDWYSSEVGLMASTKLSLPMVLTLHSTEDERSSGSTSSSISSKICAIEKKAVQGASLVIVPHSSTRQKVINQYEADPEKVVIIPHMYQEKPPEAHHDSSDVRRWFGLNQHAPIVLFAGEISHAAGADIMVDALPTVSRNHGRARFVFAGDGPLKGELEARAHHMGIGQKCRFLGDISSKNFQALLIASDFLVIPARTWQDEGLARMAITNGKPVLTTQQAGISCVRHGENGLVTFDNPGSIVWGIQELLSRSLHASMLKIVSRKKASESLSFETVTAQHYMYYEVVRKQNGVKRNV